MPIVAKVKAAATIGIAYVAAISQPAGLLEPGFELERRGHDGATSAAASDRA